MAGRALWSTRPQCRPRLCPLVCGPRSICGLHCPPGEAPPSHTAFCSQVTSTKKTHLSLVPTVCPAGHWNPWPESPQGDECEMDDGGFLEEGVEPVCEGWAGFEGKVDQTNQGDGGEWVMGSWAFTWAGGCGGGGGQACTPGTGTELLRTPRASGASPWGAGSPATLREGPGRKLVPGLAEGKHTLESPLVHRLFAQTNVVPWGSCLGSQRLRAARLEGRSPAAGRFFSNPFPSQGPRVCAPCSLHAWGTPAPDTHTPWGWPQSCPPGRPAAEVPAPVTLSAGMGPVGLCCLVPGTQVTSLNGP